ncbi:glycosyltransferase family protein [Formosa sp. 3Alg 14/1]|uniref:hypothetical protein n=1 Tax=Formosa sp. 3Alg 14/1 TaxID=3382190 RepID=UPI0039BE0FC6
MKHLLFLTTNNLATNPRLVKEVQLALQIKHRVTIIMFTLNNWSDAKSDTIITQLEAVNKEAKSNLNIVPIEAIASNKVKWFIYGFAEKIAKKGYKLQSKNIAFNAFGNTRRSFQLLFKAKELVIAPDVICAHNLGALYPAYKLALLWNIPFIFDVEDYHPGETVDFDAVNEKQRREYLMKILLPKAKALTFASPLIGEYTLDLIGSHKNTETILNGFIEEEFKFPSESCNSDNDLDSPLKLVWFSQKISFGRGLEQLFEALSKISFRKDDVIIDVTLIGELDEKFNEEIIKSVQKNFIKKPIFIHVKAPLAQKELHKLLSKFDVGLALEFNSRDLNRQICLTNKIVTYAQAGLYILATNTKAQAQFISKYPILGVLSDQTVEDIENTILQLIQQKVEIKRNKVLRFETGKQLSWNTEERKLSNLWKRIF